MKFPKWPNSKDSNQINLGLDRVLAVLNRLENPHLKLPPTIHIAGTNGKGSTLAFLKSILQEAGFKVHRYTSPHLIDFNERIELNGKKISDYFLNRVLDQCKKACMQKPEISLTFFEATTVAAFLAFKKIKADILLLETGLGGELDATNVLPEVLCSIITTISYDHQEFLGKTLKEIAKAKAGIIKKNSLVITVKQEKQVIEVIKSKAKSLQSTLIINDQAYFDSKKIKPSLLGSHQIENASLAICCIKNQKKFLVNDQQILDGITKTEWPGRLQKIYDGYFIKKLTKNSEIYVDGSHNIQGSKTIREFLLLKRNKKIYIIFSMLKDKDCYNFLNNIADLVEQIFIIKINNQSRAMEPKDILNITKKLNIKSQLIDDFQEVFSKLKNNNDSVILICGSLYLAGEFLMLNNSNNTT